jgi:hypothetical protein
MIGNYHCELVWDGNDSQDAVVTVRDLSSNGTFVSAFHNEVEVSQLALDK